MDRKTKTVPASFIKDTDNELVIDDLLKKDFDFSPITDQSIDNLDATYWILLDFKNEIDTLKTHKNWRLRTIQFREAELFYQKNGTIEQKALGKFDSEESRTSFRYNNGVLFGINDLIEGRYLFVKVKVLTFSRNITFEYLSNDSNRFFLDYYTSKDLKDISLHQVFLGACLIFFLTFMVIYFKVMKLEFLFYSLYVLFLGLYLGGAYISVTFPDTKPGYWIIIISQVVINLFYVLFAMYYLNTKKNYPKLHVLLISIIPILILVILADYLAFQSNQFMLKHRILTFQRIVMTLFGIFSMLYLLFKAKYRLALFIVIGSFCYMLGALGLLFLYNQYLMILGASIEILLFSLGLAYKIKKEYEAKLKLQEEVALKEISALRSQMNPHFIFNSLNSIQHLILKEDKVSALTYLSKFGKLARNVLESSHMATVTLDEEISLIKSYLELESLRFDNSFDYSLEIDDSLDIKNIEIPLMLIQPFVENALIHGLIGKKEGEKNLCIRFLKTEDYCTIEIEDNGIGRHSKKVKYHKTDHKSRGMEITEKRLQMLKTQNQNKNSVEIIDKYDSNGLPSGTKVIIRINNP
nr:histidine kinase [uncultured Allomuricauda sp.]